MVLDVAVILKEILFGPMKLQKTASRYLNKTFLSFVSFLFGLFSVEAATSRTFIITENCRRYEQTSSSFVPFLLPRKE